MDEIITLIKSFITKTGFDEAFYLAVLKRLVSFNYTPKKEDAWAISFCIQKVENHIKNSCNILTVPAGLYEVAVDMTCGEFLLTLKQTGQLNISTIDLSGVVTQIREGDTTVQFASGTSDEEKFTSFVNYLIAKSEGDLVCYRKLKW